MSTFKVLPRYWPLQRINYALWAITVNLVVRYGHYTGFGYALLAIARNEAEQ
jgi:hypothetical protein